MAILSGYCVGNCLRLFIVAMAMADTCVQRYALLSGYYVINCLRLFVVVIYCYHGDGSDGRHVCTQYYYQATMLEIVINCLRLFVVVTMVMVVMGIMYVQSITAIRTIIRLLCWK